MNNSMVAHLWANEQQDSAIGSNFYFEGASIYSYGHHFEAGRIVRNKRGEKAYLITTRYYSKTTATKHMPKVWGALPSHALVFCMEEFIEGGMLFVVNQLEAIKNSAERYKKNRTEISYHAIWKPFKSLMAYIGFFDLGTPKQLLKKNVNEWLGTKHELAWKSDKVKREHVRELKRIFLIMLNHQSLDILGTVNVIVDEICGEGTWASYTQRCEKYRIAKEEREAREIERFRIENEARKKSLEERILMWKSCEIRELNSSWIYYDENEPNVWLRIKNGKVETSKGIELSQTEAERLWKRIKSFHDGAQFQHDLARDSSGNCWAFNKYQNDMLTAGCHRIAYCEMESIAKQLGW
mgnify:CR=1 FL=1